MQRFESLKRTVRGTSIGLLFCAYASAFVTGQVSLSRHSAQRTPILITAKEQAAKTMRDIPMQTAAIPGPLRSFLRLAGMSQKAQPEEILPLLARRVYLSGYQGTEPTEFLILLRRYVSQARELQALTGPKNTIHVGTCAEATPLLKVLGYRLRAGCGTKDTVLETAEPERAFLTVDSGFPLTDLEEALSNGAPFDYPFPTSRVPVLLEETEWVQLSAAQGLSFGTILDVLLNNPAVGRLYYALSNLDTATRRTLLNSVGLGPLLPVAPALDFYGSQISIREGRVLVPGGQGAEAGWTKLVGVSPGNPGSFALKLLAKDNGWLAAYFDVLSRVNATQQDHLTQSPRLQHYYEAFRSTEPKNRATIGIFRQSAELLVLDTCLRWEPDGDPHVPGSMAVWKQMQRDRATAKLFRNWKRRGHTPGSPDQLVEALSASARNEEETGPLQLYLTLNELDRRRPAERQVSAETVLYLTEEFADLNRWYLIFSEFPQLSDGSAVRFLEVVDSVAGVKNLTLRANVFGAFQASVGLWQILARQHEIPEAQLDASWKSTIDPFADISSGVQLFDSARVSFRELLHASGADPDGPPSQIIDRLAGPEQTSADGKRVHDRLAARIRAALEDQQLVSLDTLFALSDGLVGMARNGGRQSSDMLALAEELRGFEMPRPVFTNGEKASWAPQVYTTHHIELQVQTDLAKVITSQPTPTQLEKARGQLSPFLRDTLVGLNYAYYEPPGAQILHANPLFVRAHDFLSISVIGSESVWRPPQVIGAGVSAGGGAYMMGSLVDLPFSLAAAEQDFIVPENVQALIWKELVPILVSEATVPRWWNVSPGQLHAVGLYQRVGEELLRASEQDGEISARVIGILNQRVSPRRLEEVRETIARKGGSATSLPGLLPAETFYLGEEYRRLYPENLAAVGPFCKELAGLASRAPPDFEPGTLSYLFGVPHPTLAQSNAPEILNLPVFPFAGGMGGRQFGESLESTNLYWARLADEMGYTPPMLHVLMPELTRHMATKIFATTFDDVPAVLRAMQETANDLRQGKIASLREIAAETTHVQAADTP